VRSPFVVDVVALRRHQGYREDVTIHAPLPGMHMTESGVPDDASVDLDLVLEAVEGGIVASGTVHAPWVGECRRCLTSVAGEVETRVEELYVRDPEEGETYPIEGDHIDLEPLAREAIVLALPLAPLCRPDCLGLCPACGADRNAGDCGHSPQRGDPRWAALDALRDTP
jgi:uncharacterized protein